MKTIFLFTGKIKNSYLIDGIRDYSKRIQNYISLEMVEIPELKNTKNLLPEKVKEGEGKLLLQQILDGDFVVLLDERGREFASREFAEFLKNRMLASQKRIVFVAGGAWGFSDEVYKRADFKLSLSRMTFPHQLVRVIFLEQLYRALSILKGEPYHND
jgi:23S rRNA (pseudouridine1915-N3)-methyltransferase